MLLSVHCVTQNDRLEWCLCFIISFQIKVILTHIFQGCFTGAMVSVLVKQFFGKCVDPTVPNHSKIQQMTTMRVFHEVYRQQQLVASAVSVILYVRYMFAFYAQMVVGLAVICPVRTHVTAPMGIHVTKIRGNLLTAVMMETGLEIRGGAHGLVPDVKWVNYKIKQESVWW